MSEQTKTPKHIWLLLNEGDEGSHLWCDDPDPSGKGDVQSVEYIRSDVVDEMISEAVYNAGITND